MRSSLSHRVLTTVAGGVGGVLAALGHAWVRGLPLWQPGRLGVCLAVGTGIGFLCARFLRPSDF